MRKFVSAAAVIALAAGAAQAEDGTDTITLAGTVSEECSVDAVSSSVNVFDGFDQIAAVVDIQCNLPGDLQVTVVSANGNKLLNSSGASTFDSIPYKWRFFPGTSSADNPNQVGNYVGGDLNVVAPSGTFLAEQRYTVEIDMDDPQTGAGQQVEPEDFFAGTYEDVMTITIAPAAGA